MQGFPTLKIFRGSEDSPTEYEGPRESAGAHPHVSTLLSSAAPRCICFVVIKCGLWLAQRQHGLGYAAAWSHLLALRAQRDVYGAGIVSFLKKQFGPAYKELSSKEDVTKATTPSDDVSVVGVFPSEGDGLTAFKAAAEALRSEAMFAYATDAKLVKDADGKEAVIVYRDFDEKTVKYDGKMDKVRNHTCSQPAFAAVRSVTARCHVPCYMPDSDTLCFEGLWSSSRLRCGTG